MLHQNDNMTHSWFVNFDKDFNSDFPLWFIRWWVQFGSTVEIFPEPLMNSLTYYLCSKLIPMVQNSLLYSISLKNIKFHGF